MDSNLIMSKEKEFIDTISDTYQYDSNIRHLLYIIIPAFIMKYGLEKEKLILNTFQDTQIISSKKENNVVKAYYSSTPRMVDGEYKTKKYMVIQNYQDISLLDLLDSLIHEFNHAINSYTNEIKVTKNNLYLRTGLTYRIYDRKSLKFIEKQSSYILEEIINTKQTSDIINIIKEFKPDSLEMNNTIYAINAETENKYQSEAYYLQSYVCKEILENRTFISTLENLRIAGEVYEINTWFDNITGERNSYKELTERLEEIYQLEREYTQKKYFKKFTLKKIKETSEKISRIIQKYNNNVIVK